MIGSSAWTGRASTDRHGAVGAGADNSQMNELDFLRHITWWSEPESELEVLPGRLPDVPGVALPRLEGVIVGSIVRRVAGSVVTIEVHYRVSGEPVEVLNRLETLLGGEGSRGISPHRPQGGFQRLPPQWDWTRYFARDDDGPYFSAFVRPIDAGTTALWIKWEGKGGWHPSQFRDDAEPRPRFGELPRINLPPGVLVPEHGSGGRVGALASDALVVTALSPVDLHDDAARQLQAAGWKRTDAARDEHAWSTWELPESGWAGVLAIMALPVADERALLLRTWSRKELE